jgi:hypothetical protein
MDDVQCKLPSDRGKRSPWTRGTLVLLALTVGCFGYAANPTLVTDTAATLLGLSSCTASTTGNPCTTWFQYWEHGSPTTQQTNPFVGNINTNGTFPFTQTVTGLSPGTLYHYQFCGKGDDLPPPGGCLGPEVPDTVGVSTPGTRPPAGDLSNTINFRTATATTGATVDLGRVLSTADGTANPISRDAGISIQYSSNPPLALWVFGDTGQAVGPLITQGTAASGGFTPGQAPTSLNELPTPPAAPQAGLTQAFPFFPAPTGLQTASGAPCGTSGTFPAAWVTGGAKKPGSSTVLLVYAEVCIFSGWWERVVLAEYDPFANAFMSFARPFVASPLGAGIPSQVGFFSPIFGNDGYLYLFAGLVVARVPADSSSWADGQNYEWWNGTMWTDEMTEAVSVIPGFEPLTVEVRDFSGITGHNLVMLTQTGFTTADFQIYEAMSPMGPWTPGRRGRVPDACSSGTFGCYAVIPHAELSTSTKVVYSWLSPDDRNGGQHLRLGEIAW